ncbi:hypothetical protein D915_007450 [Fasciola hepatica]|uniref:C2H2-type domain-containing protein n=1 Tax=Fasciola hepatica TaxID=6192 RepID=A0A4E0R5B3_FASHE|nr:hypothetical protein D915_007450 [Fasciola hepatica]
MPVCSTCGVEVLSHDRTIHVRSEWHVYNLKRVVANLPPIPEDIFLLKKQAFCEPVSQTEKKTYCNACKTLFHNNRSFDAHLKSKRHIRNSELRDRIELTTSSPSVIPNEDVPPSEDLLGWENNARPQALPLGACLFCDKILRSKGVTESEEDSSSLAARVLAHMLDAHHFLVPYPDRLVDPVGLLIELGRIVGEERSCISCGRQFYGRKGSTTKSPVALKAVRNHMLDKPGHMQLWCGESDPVRVALLIEESKEQNADTPPSVALAGGELFSRFYDQSLVVPGFILPDSEEDVYEVRLPSGTVVGHRSMRTVYRQHLMMPAVNVTHINHYALSNSGQPSSAVTSSHIGPLVMDFQPRLSSGVRDSRRYSAEARMAWELATGMQGNLVSRSRLRRQY